MGRDWIFNGAGFVAYVKVNLGKGAYVEKEDFHNKDDIFGFEKGKEAFKEKPKEKFDFENLPDEIVDSNEKEDAKVDKTFDDNELEAPNEYGYGFWMRYLTDYP